MVADILRQTNDDQDSSEKQALLTVMTNIQTYFQANLPIFQQWALLAEAQSVRCVIEAISFLQKQLIEAIRILKTNSNIQVLGSMKEDLRHELARMIDKLENFDNCLEKVQELPDHRQMDVRDELVIQL